MPLPISTAVAFLNSTGCNTHMNFAGPYQNVAQVTNSVKSLGIRRIRDGMHFLPNLDAFNVNTSALRGFGTRLCLVCDPSENLGPITSTVFDEFAWATDSLDVIEGPNEVDDAKTIPTTPAFQQSIWNAAKGMAQGLSVKVAAPSLADTGNAPQLGDLSAWCDFGNLHAYPIGNPQAAIPENFLNGLITQVKAVSGAHPDIVSECGYYTAGPDCFSEQAQAKYTPRMQLSYYAAGAKQVYIYELFDQEPASTVTDPQLHFGLIRFDGTEKPAYGAVKNMLSILSRNNCEISPLNYLLTGPSVESVLLQQTDTSWLLFLWQAVSCYDQGTSSDITNPDVNVTLSLPKSMNVSVYKPLLQAEELVVYENAASVPLWVSDHLSIIKIG